MGKWLTDTGDHTDEPIPVGAHVDEQYAPVVGEPHAMVSRRLIAFDGGALVVYDEWTHPDRDAILSASVADDSSVGETEPHG